MAQNKKIILGIDPGTNFLGYANILIEGQNLSLINMGAIDISVEKDPYLKLKRIFEKVQFLIQTHQATELAIEAPFYGKNVQSMLKLGRAQGVAIVAGSTLGTPVFEYAPKKIKQSITGNGNASKEQVAAMLKSMLQFKVSPKYLDATDALSVAVCHHLQGNSFSVDAKKFKDWGAFIQENPSKIR